MAGLLQASFGALTAFPGVARLNSLAHGQAVTLGTINNAALLALDFSLILTVILGASGVSAGGFLRLYLLESLDDLTWKDGIDGDATGNQAANIKTLRAFDPIEATVNGATVRAMFELVGQSGRQAGTNQELAPIAWVKPYLSLLVENQSGAALAASGHSASYLAFKAQVIDL